MECVTEINHRQQQLQQPQKPKRPPEELIQHSQKSHGFLAASKAKKTIKRANTAFSEITWFSS